MRAIFIEHAKKTARFGQIIEVGKTLVRGCGNKERSAEIHRPPGLKPHHRRATTRA
jgi:hypothetical protein